MAHGVEPEDADAFVGFWFGMDAVDEVSVMVRWELVSFVECCSSFVSISRVFVWVVW